MSPTEKQNRSDISREQEYYARTRGLGFDKAVDSAPDHRDAEDGLTADGLPAWHGDGNFLSRKEWQEAGHGRRRPRRPRSPERHIKASCNAALERFSRHQDAIRPALDEGRSAERGMFGRLWRYLRNH